MRYAVPVLAATAILVACGGGGDDASGGGAPGGGGTELFVTLSYADAPVPLFQQVAVQPRLGGFEGHAPKCTLVSGAMPPGLSMGGDCVVSGRALQAGPFSFVVRVGAAGASNSIEQSASIRVQAPLVQYPFLHVLALGESVDDLPTLANWTAPADLQATWSYRIISGALPEGLKLDASSGRISGAARANGPFSAVVQSTLSTQFGTHTPAASEYAVNVSVPSIAYGSGPTPTVTAYLSQPLLVEPVTIGRAAPGTVFSDVTVQGTLPEGILLDAATGVLSGTPKGTSQGQTPFDVQATASSAGVSAPTQGLLLLQVASPVIYAYGGNGQIDLAFGEPVTITPARTELSPLPLQPDATVTFQGRAGDCTLPPGMALDSASGSLSGTPAARGTFHCFVEATVTNGGISWSVAGQAFVVVH